MDDIITCMQGIFSGEANIKTWAESKRPIIATGCWQTLASGDGFIFYHLQRYVAAPRCGTRQKGPPDDKGKKLVGSVPRPAVEMGSMVPVRWSALAKGWIKINVDGAFKKNGDASLGVVIRDDAGKVLLSA